MAIALPILVHLFAPLHGAVEWLAGGGPAVNADNGRGAATAAHLTAGLAAPSTVAGRVRSRVHARMTPVGKSARSWAGPTRAPERPLRVVRVVEPRHPCNGAGRMVISGRMADVCAELDRLAAVEAQERAVHA